jgi:lysophospholipase L1-like esterase
MRRAAAGAFVVVVAVMCLAAPAGAVPGPRSEIRKPGPLRVLLTGDSITVTYQDRTAQLLEARGYQVIKAGIGGASLLDQGICGVGYANALVAYVDPDVVIIQYSGNYGTRRDVPKCKPEKTFGSPAWLRRWASAAGVNQRRLARRGARVLWVETPSVDYSPKREIVPKLNAIYRTTGETIDVWTAFGGDWFDPSLRYDVQHLNGRGAQKVAELVNDAVG